MLGPFGWHIHDITGIAATTWSLRPRCVSVAGDGAFLLDQDDFGGRPDLFAAVGYLRPSKEKLLAAGGGQLPGVRGQTMHYGARVRRTGGRRALQSRPPGSDFSPGQRAGAGRR